MLRDRINRRNTPAPPPSLPPSPPPPSPSSKPSPTHRVPVEAGQPRATGAGTGNVAAATKPPGDKPASGADKDGKGKSAPNIPAVIATASCGHLLAIAAMPADRQVTKVDRAQSQPCPACQVAEARRGAKDLRRAKEQARQAARLAGEPVVAKAGDVVPKYFEPDHLPVGTKIRVEKVAADIWRAVVEGPWATVSGEAPGPNRAVQKTTRDWLIAAGVIDRDGRLLAVGSTGETNGKETESH